MYRPTCSLKCLEQYYFVVFVGFAKSVCLMSHELLIWHQTWGLKKLSAQTMRPRDLGFLFSPNAAKAQRALRAIAHIAEICGCIKFQNQAKLKGQVYQFFNLMVKDKIALLDHVPTNNIKRPVTWTDTEKRPEDFTFSDAIYDQYYMNTPFRLIWLVQ